MPFLLILGLIGAAYILLLATGDTVNTNATPGVQALAKAIATAEGFYVKGSRPQRDNNPGDMTQDLIGKGVGMDGPFVVYGNVADGWANLYAQINLWLSGGSSHANPDSTISDLSSFYTTDSPPGAQNTWAVNVANDLGVSTDTPIGQFS
jgi:hypothetical protein